MKNLFFLLFIIIVPIFASTALPAQINAIKVLAEEQGFTNQSLDNYLIKTYETTVYGLTRNQAIEIINNFQSNNPPKPLQLETRQLKNAGNIKLEQQLLIPFVNNNSREIIQKLINGGFPQNISNLVNIQILENKKVMNYLLNT